MSRTAIPAAPLAQLTFELEHFRWAGEDSLEVTGRWFGVRGRRFVRPTLTLRAAGRRRRLTPPSPPPRPQAVAGHRGRALDRRVRLARPPRGHHRRPPRGRTRR